MNRQNIQTNTQLSKIINNTQYLSNIYHISQFTTKNIDKLNQQQFSIKSMERILIQMTYLLYTCSYFKIGIYLKNQFGWRRKLFSTETDPYLIFLLEDEIQLLEQKRQDIYNKYQYLDLRKGVRQFNIKGLQLLSYKINIIQQIIKNSKKYSNKYSNTKKLQQLNTLINNNIKPKLLNNTDFPVINQLQKSQLFQQHSNLLTIQRNSIFYKAKHHKQIFEQLHQLKSQFIKLKQRYKYKLKIYSRKVYQLIDQFLHLMIIKNIIFVRKSHSQQPKDRQKLEIGYINNVVYKLEEVQEYFVQFYTIDGQYEQKTIINDNNSIKGNNGNNGNNADKQSQKKYRNNYHLQINYIQNKISLRYLINFQVNAQTIDIIANHCSNISFRDKNINIETFMSKQLSTQEEGIKKLVAFKCVYRMQQDDNQQPFTPFLMLCEYVLICAKIYSQMIRNLPSKTFQAQLDQNLKRIQHAMKIVGSRVEAFYNKI